MECILPFAKRKYLTIYVWIGVDFTLVEKQIIIEIDVNNLTFADKTDEKRPQIQYLCWFAALLSCHFFIVFFLFFCLCQNFFYFSQSSNAFAEIDIHGCPDIF